MPRGTQRSRASGGRECSGAPSREEKPGQKHCTRESPPWPSCCCATSTSRAACRTAPDNVLVEIVDEVFVPLVAIIRRARPRHDFMTTSSVTMNTQFGRSRNFSSSGRITSA